MPGLLSPVAKESSLEAGGRKPQLHPECSCFGNSNRKRDPFYQFSARQHIERPKVNARIWRAGAQLHTPIWGKRNTVEAEPTRRTKSDYQTRTHAHIAPLNAQPLPTLR